MTQEHDLALKGPGVEEWLDVRFFRPIGILLARALLPTRVTPNQVTLASLALGLVAAHMFYYDGWAINAAAFALTVIADLLDSSDGQLARLRGTPSRTGRLLDGFADNVRWIAVYTHVAFRIMAAGHGLWVVPAAFAVGYAHSMHSATVDLISHAYLELAGGEHAVDLPDEVGAPPRGYFWKHAWPFYAAFVQQQERLFPRTIAAIRAARRGAADATTRRGYANAARPALLGYPWIGQNAHILALGAAGIVGAPLAFFATGVAMTAVAIVLRALQERAGARFVRALDDRAAA